MRIDQWVPVLHAGDAIGDSARLMRDAFRRLKHQADVYALDLDPELIGDGRLFSDWKPGAPGDVVILHFALPSPLTDALIRHSGRRAILYHNITPAEFFTDYDAEMARICRVGRDQLRQLVGHVDLALADSEFNCDELRREGFARTGVMPIFMNMARYREAPSRVMRRALADGRTNVLFVGRVAPNKRHDDLIRIASYWKRFIGPELRLLLVGKLPRRATGRGEPLKRHYFDALQSLLYEEGLTPDEVVFTGHVDHADLLACYASAHAFVSMSEHEGYGVPLVEAMLMNVPIVAYRSTAVADTLGGAGLQVTSKRIEEIAELLHLVTTDARLRRAVLDGQDRRLGELAPERLEASLRGHLVSLGVS